MKVVDITESCCQQDCAHIPSREIKVRKDVIKTILQKQLYDAKYDFFLKKYKAK